MQREDARTDVIVLACTHYPLLLQSFARLAPWPVDWIDSARAIARRADQVLAENLGPDAPNGDAPRRSAIFTSGAAPSLSLAATLARYGLPAT